MADNLTPETNPVPIPEQPQPNPMAEQFQRVAKQEKFVAEERRKIEEAKKAFEQDKQEVEKYRGLKSKNPFEILEHFGISYDRLLEADRNRNSTPVDPLAKKALETVDQLRMELNAKDQAAQKERLSRAETKLMSDIETAVKDNDYDLIANLGEQTAVREYMEEMYNQTGQIPDIKEACEAVSLYLAEKVSRVKDSRWLKPKDIPQETETVEHTPKKAATLSNKMTQSTVGADKPMTDQDRLKAAIAAMGAVKSK